MSSKPRAPTPRYAIADAIGCDASILHPYQHGRHKPALWTDGEAYYCAAKILAPDHAGLVWRRLRDGIDVWVSDLL